MIARGILHSGTELKLPSRPPGHRPEVLAPFDSAHPIYKAIDEQSQRLAFERQRVELALIISETLNDDLIFETQRAWGAEETRATYKQEFGKFQEWCRDQKLPSLPTSPEVVALFLLPGVLTRALSDWREWFPRFVLFTNGRTRHFVQTTCR